MGGLTMNPEVSIDNNNETSPTANSPTAIIDPSVIDKLYQCHMEEYRNSRSEVVAYTRATDRILFVWLSASFAFIGLIFNVDQPADKIKLIVEIIKTDLFAKSLILFLTILQAFLVLLVVAYILSLFRHSKYTSSVLRPRIAKLLSVDSKSLLSFDITRNDETKLTNNVRLVITGLWFGFMIAFNLGVIAWMNWDYWHNNTFTLILLGLSILFNAAALSIAARNIVLWTDERFDSDEYSFPDQVKTKMRSVSFAVFITVAILFTLSACLGLLFN